MIRNYPGTLVVSTEMAKELAAPYCRFNDYGDLKLPKKTDPFANKIKASLLSAVEIKKYVEETGAIAPFYVGTGKDSLLKEAAYEGRIGDKAYMYDDEGKRVALLNQYSKVLRIPANSIVFVESDLDFRVPEFIALRFNLQIKHVHRGLLLGTGPLIDPGYWGKLCIPLHNLTDADYEISLDEGLIWIEFTRTSAVHSNGDERLGRPPLGKPFWEIEDLIEKAALDNSGKIVPIRSSIPVATREATESATEATRQAATAKNALLTIGIGSGVLGLAAILALFYALASIIPGYTSVTQNKLDAIEPKVREMEMELSRHLDRVTTDAGAIPESVHILENLVRRVEQLESSDTRRQAQNQDLGATLSAMVTSVNVVENLGWPS